jgi:GTPase
MKFLLNVYFLKQIKRSELRKGMVLVSEKLNPVASFEFEAEILVLHHPTTISVQYQAMSKRIIFFCCKVGNYF